MNSRSVALGAVTRALLRHLGECLELTKPRLTCLVLVTTATGFWLGLRPGARPPSVGLTLLSMALVVGGANALNQWMEREADALMQRTKQRPLPSGRLAPALAHRFGLTLVVGGVLGLALVANTLSAVLAAVAAVSYLIAYTPLKRVTPLCTLVGAVAGALPPMIGWAAARDALGIEAWVLFGLLFIWQLPHFLAIAVLFHDDYARASFRMLPVAEPEGGATARQMALAGFALLPLSLFPTCVGLSGAGYFYGALMLSVLFLMFTVRTAVQRSRVSAQHLFLASIVYLPALMILLSWNKVSG